MTKHWRALVGLAALAFAGSASAQDPTSDEILLQLKPKMGKTRSLKPATGDRQFIEALKSGTRAIKVEERKQLTEIVEKNEMPSLDLEVNFALNSAEITPEAVGILVKLGKALSDPALAQSDFMVSGHTDARGSDEHNQQLSEARAETVKKFLVENYGIDAHKLIAVGYGEEKLKNPGDPNADENRRVNIVNLAM